MKGSSARSRHVFRGVRLAKMTHLLRVIMGLSIPAVSVVQRRYEEQQREFSETLQCLMDLGFVEAKDRRLVVSLALGAEKQHDWVNSHFPYLLWRRILQGTSPYREETLAFLRAFRIAGQRITADASPRMSNRHADVRNLLVDLGVVVLDHPARMYVLSPNAADLFLDAKRRSGTTREDLAEQLQRRDAMGRRAEQVVLDYEKERLGPSLAGHIQHVAELDVAAGYDILSVTVAPGGELLTRCIEVKAVALEDYGFHWTRNELRVAGLLKEHYFLYLLPVGSIHSVLYSCAC